jgi:hypothetical protein
MVKDDVTERAMAHVRGWFGAKNVRFDNVHWNDEIRFKVTDDNGATIGRPIQIDRWQFKSESLLAERLADEQKERGLRRHPGVELSGENRLIYTGGCR